MLPGYHPRREGRAAYEAVAPAAVIAHARRLLRLRPRARCLLPTAHCPWPTRLGLGHPDPSPNDNPTPTPTPTPTPNPNPRRVLLLTNSGVLVEVQQLQAAQLHYTILRYDTTGYRPRAGVLRSLAILQVALLHYRPVV